MRHRRRPLAHGNDNAQDIVRDNAHGHQTDHVNADAPWVDQGAGEPDGLQRLWAPYRKAYLTEKSADPFVAAPQKSDEESLIVARGNQVYALLNLFPYNAGHLLVVPYRKVANVEDLDIEESQEFMSFIQMAIRVLKKVSNPHAINVGMNLGGASGGSVRDHLHAHIVPRWQGDANFLTIIDGTKVLPELLADTRTILAQGWKEISAEFADEKGANCH